MKKINTVFPDVWIIEPDIFKDERGYFFESYSYQKFKKLNLNTTFLQDNQSKSILNTVRGLHFQAFPGQVKLVRCTIGKIWDIVVDIRPNSSNFKKWFGVELSDENFLQVFIPIGYAHGYSVLSKEAEIQYKVNNYYNASIERTIQWNDSSLNIDWKVKNPILSGRDQTSLSLNEFLKRYPDPFAL